MSEIADKLLEMSEELNKQPVVRSVYVVDYPGQAGVIRAIAGAHSVDLTAPYPCLSAPVIECDMWHVRRWPDEYPKEITAPGIYVFMSDENVKCWQPGIVSDLIAQLQIRMEL